MHAAQAQRVRVEIPPVIYQADDAFTLGDAATLSGPARAREALSPLLLSAYNGILTRDEVLQAIEASGLGNIRVELHMPLRVRVELPGPEGNETETGPFASGMSSSAEPQAQNQKNQGRGADAGLQAVIKSLAAWDGDVQVTANGPVPPGRVVDPAAIVPGTPAATLRFRDDAGRIRSLAVRLNWSQNILVAARTLKKDVPIRREDLMTRSMKITRPGVYAAKESEAVGQVPRRIIKQGEPVPLDLLSGPARLKKGRKVKIVARYGGLTATAEGVLMEDGSPGDWVRVRRANSKKSVVKACILDENTVEVKVQ